MNELKELWAKKYEKQGRINITVFFVNIFLLLCHVFFMIMYIIINHKFMICINIISLLVYIFSIFSCYKNIERYMGIAFLEIWIHMMFGILSFGWTPCYQNWSFGMIVAYFLPAFNPNSSSNRDRKELELSRKADYDQLTELYNRRAINQLSDQIIKTSKETKKSYYIAILDIDFFKKVNDTYGHNAGDIVLKKVASIIKAFSIRGIQNQ